MLPGIRSLAVAIHLEIYWVYISSISLNYVIMHYCYIGELTKN
ncbi:hypothetical protein [Photorhabdus australis]